MTKIRITSQGKVYDLDLPISVSDIPTTQPVDPAVFSIAASPASITVGQSSTITCAFEQVGGAWLMYNAVVKALEGPVATTNVAPTATTVYTLRIKRNDGTFDESKKATVAVTAAPPPPQPTEVKHRVGVHFMNSAGAALNVLALGLRDVCALQDYETCKQLCDALGKTAAFDGKGVVMFREYINYWPTVQQALSYCRPGFDKRIVRIITNESEFLPGGNSVEGILRHAALDVAVAREMAKTGECAALGTFAVGNPDITDPAICKAVHDGYADWFNNGFAQTGVHPVWDQHTYSPDPQHIYNTWQGDVTMQTYKNAQRNLHIYEQDWHETRPAFYYELCGFNLRGGGMLMSSETGVDKMGTGGMPSVGMSAADCVNWMRAYLAAWKRPVTDMYNNTGVMPMASSVIFQGGDPSTAQGHWGGYYVGNWFNEMSAVWKE